MLRVVLAQVIFCLETSPVRSFLTEAKKGNYSEWSSVSENLGLPVFSLPLFDSHSKQIIWELRLSFPVVLSESQNT
jgi:hypothetical protein